MGPKLFRAGDPTQRGAGESLGSLQENATKHRNWYDLINELGGKGLDTIDFTQRAFDDNGRVKVTKYDVLLGRSQPELQAEYERQRQATVRNSPANQQFARDNNGTSAVPALGERLYEPQTTNAGDIQDLNSREAARVEATEPLLDELGRMKGGQLAIAQLPLKPTQTQVAAAIGRLTPDQPSSIRAGEIHDDNLATNAASRRIADASLELAQDRERNSNALERARIDFQNQTNQYNYKNAERDRELQRDLALLGFDDKDADRRFDREERRDQTRQMLILQMMKGLQNFGASFAL